MGKGAWKCDTGAACGKRFATRRGWAQHISKAHKRKATIQDLQNTQLNGNPSPGRTCTKTQEHSEAAPTGPSQSADSSVDGGRVPACEPEPERKASPAPPLSSSKEQNMSTTTGESPHQCIPNTVGNCTICGAQLRPISLTQTGVQSDPVQAAADAWIKAGGTFLKFCSDWNLVALRIERFTKSADGSVCEKYQKVILSANETAPAAEQPPKDWKEWLRLAESDIKRWQDLARGKLPGLLSEWMNRDQGVPEDPEVERLLGIILKHWSGKPLRCDHCETEVTRPGGNKDG